MKLIIQIPCFDEEEYLPTTLAELPRKIEGIDVVEWLVIDDGSIDKTVEVAHNYGVDHIIQHRKNKGLAKAFKSGIDACISLGADIIVNTDADNQYPARYITDLVRPILMGEGDIVIGDRQTDKIHHFSFTKKILLKIGSWVVRKVSGTEIPDAPSGFRAYSRKAALRLNITTDYTYTLETIIQAGKKNLDSVHIPIETNPVYRESRLIRSNWSYVFRSFITIFHLFILYEPLRFFSFLAFPFIVFGATLWLRFLILLIAEQSLRGAYLQSVIVGGIGLLVGTLLWCLGLLGHLLTKNRYLLEEQTYLLKKKSDLSNVSPS